MKMAQLLARFPECRQDGCCDVRAVWAAGGPASRLLQETLLTRVVGLPAIAWATVRAAGDAGRLLPQELPSSAGEEVLRVLQAVVGLSPR